MYVETIAGSLEVILGYFVIVPLIVKLVSSVIAVAVIWAKVLNLLKLKHAILRSLGCSLATTNYQLKIKIYSGENS